VLADAVTDGLLARSGAQSGGEGAAPAEVEPMPDWERELLGASQEPAAAVPDETPAADAAPVPGDEQPEEAAEEAEEAGDAALQTEQQQEDQRVDYPI
jgi:small subunit ribosomal protein S2